MRAQRSWNAPTMISVAGLAILAMAGSAAGVAQAAASRTPDRVATADRLSYVPIKEPFGTPGACDPAGTTVEMTNCYLIRVVDIDQQIDVLQRQRFTYAPTTAHRRSYLKNDAAWLRHRTAEVRKIDSGGSLDAIKQAQLTLRLSRQRLAALT